GHGCTVRLLVSGWYGVASVKWLKRIEVVDHVFQGYFQTRKYTIQRHGPHGLEMQVVGPMVLKSEIIRPRADEILGLGTNRLFGVAFAGSSRRWESTPVAGPPWVLAECRGPQVPLS